MNNIQTRLLNAVASLTLATALVPAQLQAQTLVDQQDAEALPAIEPARKGPIADDLRVAGLGYEELNADAQLSTSDGMVSADFSLDYNFAGAPRTIKTAKGNVVFGSYTNVSVKASVPLNPVKQGSSVDFKNFGNNGHLTVNFNHFAPSFADPVELVPFKARFAETCLVEQAKEWTEHTQVEGGKVLTPEQRLSQTTVVLGAFRGSDNADELWDERVSAAAGADGAGGFGAVALQQCTAGNGHPMLSDTDLVLKYASLTLTRPGEYQAFSNRFIKPSTTGFWGGSLSLGFNRFSIVNRPAFVIDRTQRVGFDLNMRAGKIWSQSGLMVAIGGGYTRTYKAKDEVEICGAPNISGVSTCIKGLDGAPERTDTAYAEVSLRYVLLRDKHGTPLIGMAPRAAYIREDNAFQVTFPVFFQHSKEGGLDAGIQAIWNSDKKRVAVGAFIGVPFGGF